MKSTEGVFSKLRSNSILNYDVGFRGLEEVVKQVAKNETASGSDVEAVLADLEVMVYERAQSKDLACKGEKAVALPRDVHANSFIHGVSTGLKKRQWADVTLNSESFLPVDESFDVFDGVLTAGAYSTEKLLISALPCDERVTNGHASVNTFVVAPRNGKVNFRDVRSADSEHKNMAKNILTMLTFASLDAEYENAEIEGFVKARQTFPLISTSHIAEFGHGSTTKREYDVSTASSNTLINLKTKIDGDQLDLDGCSTTLKCAILIAYQVHPALWNDFFEGLVPPSFGGQLPSMQGIMRRAIAELDIQNDELRLLIAETAATTGRVYGMSDESMVEQLTISYARAVPFGDTLFPRNGDSLPAADVSSWQVKGVLTLELAFTRLFSLFAPQTDRNKYERSKHYDQLSSAGFALFAKDEEGQFVLPIASIISTNVFRKSVTSTGTVKSQFKARPVGHVLRELVTSDLPLMRKGVASARDVLMADNLLGAKARGRYATDVKSEGSYACSVATEPNEYVSGPRDTDGSMLTNVMAARATAGALNSLVGWLDSACVLDGNDRSEVNIMAGCVVGSEARVTTVATELKRYGFELRVSDKLALGVGNPRKDYAFTTNAQETVAARIERTSRQIGKRAATSTFMSKLTVACTSTETQPYILCLYRALNCIKLKKGVVTNPRFWHQARIDNNQVIVGSATFGLSFSGGSTIDQVVVTSSSLNRPINEFGGFNKKTMRYGVKACELQDPSGKFFIQADIARLGTRVSSATYAAMQCGQFVDQESLAEAMDAAATLADDQELEYAWASQEGYNAARALYQKPLSSTDKRTLKRAVWHACTGFILFVTKACLVYEGGENSTSEVTPAARLDQVHRVYAAYSSRVRYVVSLLVGEDANWPNPIGLVHVYQLAVTPGHPKDMLSSDDIHSVLSTPTARVKNGKCTRMDAPCQVSCFARLDDLHECRRCKCRVTCALCIKALCLTGYAHDGGRKPNDHETTPATGGDILHAKTMGSEHVSELHDTESIVGAKPMDLAPANADVRSELVELASNLLKINGRRPSAQVKKLSVGNADEGKNEQGFESLSESDNNAQEIDAESSGDVSMVGETSEQQVRDAIAHSEAESRLFDDTADVDDKLFEACSYVPGDASEVGASDVDITPKKSAIRPPMSSRRSSTPTPAASRGLKFDVDLIADILHEPPKMWDQSREFVEQTEPLVSLEQCTALVPMHAGFAMPVCSKLSYCDILSDKSALQDELVVNDEIINFKVPEQEEVEMSTSIFAVERSGEWIKLLPQRQKLKLSCGRDHSMTGPHWCVLKKQDGNSSLRKIISDAGMTDKLVRSQLIRRIIPGKPSTLYLPGSAMFRDVTKNCVCAGCSSFKRTNDPNMVKRSAVDFPIWHYDLGELHSLDIKIPQGQRDSIVGDLMENRGAMEQYCAIKPWLSNMLGFMVKPGTVNQVSGYGDFHFSNPRINVSTRPMSYEADYNLWLFYRQPLVMHINKIHASLPCCSMGYGDILTFPPDLENGMPFEARMKIDKSIVFNSHDDETKMFLIAALASLLWPRPGEEAPQRASLSFSGVMLGDMRHYSMNRIVRDGKLTNDSVLRAVTVPDRMDKVEKLSKVRVSDKTIELFSRFRCPETLKYLN
uniref:Uncharacterized protein n=1 Tax=Amasya cherry disease-associated mycovirus TaxID=284689 RepID=Q1HA36_9VIRU|nr:hypothetical protein [Amasya cherry disease-associated mycovirus]